MTRATRVPFGWSRWSLVLLLWGLPIAAFAEETRLLVVTGVSGDEAHAKDFQQWGASLVDAARKRGLSDVVYLAENPAVDAAHVSGRSTRDAVLKASTDMAARAKPDDLVFILLIGHGSFDGRQGAFNLPGPDLTVDDVAGALKKLSAQRVVFVNTASSSGAFLEGLAGPRRTIVTATRTGGERNETRFARFFVEALEGDLADRDRNGRISLQEAFDYARTKVTGSYEQEGHLLTEHATLDDGSQGAMAATTYFGASAPQTAASSRNPKVAALAAERDALERQVAELRVKKGSMDAARYDAELERLLTELALKSRELRDLEGAEAQPRQEGQRPEGQR
jgi:hypothetical protein